jgi:hypothetical protein
MRRQQQRKSRERQVITLLIHMPRGIEADHGNHHAAGDIGLRGAAHPLTVPATPVADAETDGCRR